MFADDFPAQASPGRALRTSNYAAWVLASLPEWYLRHILLSSRREIVIE